MASYNDVLENYQSINQSINKLRKYLINQLKKCYIADIDDYNFTELIEAVGTIKATEYHNSNNKKPLNEPKINSSNLTTYNQTLYQKIRYYMGTLAYFLVLKGVSNAQVAQQKDLKGLISLIDQINVKAPSSLMIQNITEDYYYGSLITLDYSLTDINGYDIREGEIVVESNGIVYDLIKAGEQLSFLPIAISDKDSNGYIPTTFTFTYHGSDNYDDSYPITRNIIIKPSKVNIEISPFNVNEKSKYYLQTDIGYQTDEWEIYIWASNFQGGLEDVPLQITINNETFEEITDEDGGLLLKTTINNVGTQKIIVESIYENTDDITNTTAEFTFNIKYYPLYQAKDSYNDYLGKTSYTYELIIINEDTGENNDLLIADKDVSISLDGQIIGTTRIINNKATYTIPTPYITQGEHILYWNNEGNQAQTFINLYSNFILPDTDKFYIDNTPDVIYAPLQTEYYNTSDWNPMAEKEVNASIKYNKIINVEHDDDTDTDIVEKETTNYNVTLTTDSNGVLTGLKDYVDIGEYEVIITSNSDSLSETITYKYEETESYVMTVNKYSKRNPFELEIQVEIYDDAFTNIQSYLIHNPYAIEGIKRIENDNILTFYYGQNITEGQYTHYLKLNDKIINDDLTFSFISNPITLLTNVVTIGANHISLSCTDDSIEAITLESDYIIANEITKENGVFDIDATFLKVGENIFTIHTEDEEFEFSITVEKGDLLPSIVVQKVTPNGQTQTVYDEDTGEEQTIVMDLIEEVDEIDSEDLSNIDVLLLFENELIEDIDVTFFFDDVSVETYTITAEEDENKIFKIPNTDIGNHTLSFIYTASIDDSYNSFSIEKEISIITISYSKEEFNNMLLEYADTNHTHAQYEEAINDIWERL